MLRSVLLAILALGIAILGGAASAWWALEHEGHASGGWTPLADPLAAEADPYVRARLSRAGRLTLGRAEGLSFVVREDEAGAPLQGGCTYLLAGALPAARLWTLWAADAMLRPLPGRGRRPSSLHSQQTLRPAEGGMRVVASRLPQPGNWLLVDAVGPFAIVLTLYDTPAAGGPGAGPQLLPRITPMGCGDA